MPADQLAEAAAHPALDAVRWPVLELGLKREPDVTVSAEHTPGSGLAAISARELALVA